MTIPDQSKGDRSRDEVLAGEYVLGVLGLEARREVEARMRRDGHFAAIVRRWEDNLSQFDDDYAPVAPPAGIYRSIESRLFLRELQTAARPRSPFIELWNSLLLWRGLAFASLGALLVIAGQQIPALLAPKPQLLTAPMAAADSPITLLANFDATSGLLRVMPAAGDAGQKSLELWLVEGGNAPHSLGVLPDSGIGEVKIPSEMRKRFAPGAVIAVSLEPHGGSPTGIATGPVIASGALRR